MEYERGNNKKSFVPTEAIVDAGSPAQKPAPSEPTKNFMDVDVLNDGTISKKKIELKSPVKS